MTEEFEKENKNRKHAELWGLVMGIAHESLENVLLGWALAATDETLKDSVFAEDFKNSAVAMGATEEDFRNALGNIGMMKSLFGDDLKEDLDRSHNLIDNSPE